MIQFINLVSHSQIDVLDSPVWKNVILLQTVLEETRKRSQANYKKLKEMMAERGDNFYVFINEHHKLVEAHDVHLYLFIYLIFHAF